MPPQMIKIKDPVVDCDITTTALETLTNTNLQVQEVLRLLIDFHAIVPMDDLKFKRKPGPDPTLYEYAFQAADGRLWQQTLTIDGQVEASMDFDVPDQWALSEFAPHRPIRAILIDMAEHFSDFDFTAKF